MKISLAWLNGLLGSKLKAPEVVELFSQAGLPVDSVRRLDAECEGVVVGEVLSVAPHPNADRLKVTTVQIGPEERRQIVCGAPNVAVGQKVPVARPGSKLAKGLILQATTIRGIQSDGMICAPDELGLGIEHNGILVLSPSATVGRSLSSCLKLDDVVLDIEVTPNRADCMSVVGLAREIAALQGRKFQPEMTKLKSAGPKRFTVRVADKAACPKYSVRAVRGVHPVPTPDWMRARLIASGIRPINLIVDVTNYVMLELGQPLHAFDVDRLPGSALVVRRAKAGETLITLDGVLRKLDPSMLVIASPERILALAGVMGGADSEVRRITTDVLLESAVFAPSVVRKTARSLHLLSEASVRFERGIDWAMTEVALDRAAQMIVDLGGGELDGAKIVVAKPASKSGSITLPLEDIEKFLNLHIPRTKIIRMLTSLGCTVRGSTKTLRVVPPTWRVDLKIPADLLEEIARVYGYHNLTPTALTARLHPPVIQACEKREELARDSMVQLGYSEVYSRDTDAAGSDNAGANAWRIANPLDLKQAVLRRTLLRNLLVLARQNLERSADNKIALFEIGTVFLRPANSRQPIEERTCGATLWTIGKNQSWPGENAKGHCTRLFESLSLPTPRFAEGKIFVEAEPVGVWTTDEQILMGKNIYHCEHWEVSLTKLNEIRRSVDYQPIGQFPPVKRDLALWVPKDLEFSRLSDVIRKASPLVEGIEPFDLYEKDGRQSLALHLVFQAPERTLAAPEVESAVKTIIASLTSSLNVSIRI